MEMRRAISKDEMANLPIRRFDGEVRLIASSHELERARAEVRRESLLGFDTETRPAFRKGESYPPALAQLAGEHAVWIFQLQRVDCSLALAEILAAAGIVKTGVGMADDLRQLKKVFPFTEASVVDVGSLAKRLGIEQTGIRNLAGLVLGYRIPKGKRTSNWAAQQLTREQIGYAAMDAWAARELYLKLSPVHPPGLLPAA
jgi:ribonuclease D